MTDHEAMRHAISAYVLDALDDDERARIERDLLEHLPGCPECSATMQDMREIAGDLALAAPAVEPSELTTSRLMNAVREDGRSERARATAPRSSRSLRVVAAVAGVALLASGAFNAMLASRLDDVRARADALAPVFELAAHPDARAVSLRGEASGFTLLYRPDGDAMLVGRDVPAPPSGKLYELWYIDGTPVPVTTFVPRDGIVVVRLPSDPSGARGVAITVEERFVRAPTSAPVYAGTLTA